MKALLLAAGKGTRLLPLTERQPKCMVRIHNKPLLDYWIDALVSENVSEIYINVHHCADAVVDHIQTHRHQERIVIVEEKELLGTAGTIRSLAPKFIESEVLVIHADNFCLAPLNQFIDCYHSRPNGVDIAMMTFRCDDPKSCGIVVLDHMGLVKDFFEKSQNPPDNLANGAVFLISQNVIKQLTTTFVDAVDFSADVIPQFLGKIIAWENTIYHRDIGTPQSYQKCNADLKLLLG